MGSADCDSLADSLIPCAGLAGGKATTMVLNNDAPIVVGIAGLPAGGTNMYHDLLIL